MAKKMDVVEDSRLGVYTACKKGDCSWVSKYVDTREEALRLHGEHYRVTHVEAGAVKK